MKAKAIYLLLPFALAVLVGAACASSNTGQKVGERSSSDGQAATAAPKLTIYRVADVIQVQDHTIVLNSASMQGGLLTANFTIENTGNKELAISSLLSFSAKDSEGNKLEQALLDCPSGSLDGKVLPGDKLRGNICWKAPASGKVRIYYEAKLFGSGAVVWEVNP